jgi:hypothetical protein
MSPLDGQNGLLVIRHHERVCVEDAYNMQPNFLKTQGGE